MGFTLRSSRKEHSYRIKENQELIKMREHQQNDMNQNRKSTRG